MKDRKNLNRKKLLFALASVMLAYLFYRLALLFILVTTGIVFIVIAGIFFIAAIVIFALYFEE